MLSVYRRDAREKAVESKHACTNVILSGDGNGSGMMSVIKRGGRNVGTREKVFRDCCIKEGLWKWRDETGGTPGDRFHRGEGRILRPAGTLRIRKINDSQHNFTRRFSYFRLGVS